MTAVDTDAVRLNVGSRTDPDALGLLALCDELDRLRAEHALIRGDNATLGATVTELRAENAALRAVADAVLEDAFGTDDDPHCIVDGRLLARLRDALAAALEADR